MNESLRPAPPLGAPLAPRQPLRLVLHVAPTPKDAAEQRRALLDGIRRWGLDLLDERIEDVELLAGEVIANAAIHTGKPSTVTATWTGAAVRVEVADESDQVPSVREHFGEAVTSGQGLNLVRALSDAWGVKVDECAGTKVVWFECGSTEAAADPGAALVAAVLRADTTVRAMRPQPQVGTLPARPVLRRRIPAA
ncbi:ATP-binding protein [Kitasatospora sp. NPDC094028]